jgi:para-nitrobenzyl esterase
MSVAKGLFNRVISQSMAIMQPNPPTKYTNLLMKKLGIETQDIKKLQEVEIEALIKAQNEVLDELFEAGEGEWIGFRPGIDIEGKTLPILPLDAIKQGEGKNIDLLIGCTEEEGKLSTHFTPDVKNISMEILEREIRDIVRPLRLELEAKTLIQKYQNARKDLIPNKPIDILNALLTDFVYRIPNIHIAEAQSKHNSNVFFYIFTWKSPLIKGAGHFVEIPFVFGTLDQKGNKYLFGKGPEAKLLSEKTMDAWIAFARTGNPNHSKIPEWPVYDIEKRATMMMGKDCEVVNAPFEKERMAWDGLHKW